jgi:hypothetical protein
MERVGVGVGKVLIRCAASLWRIKSESTKNHTYFLQFPQYEASCPNEYLLDCIDSVLLYEVFAKG